MVGEVGELDTHSWALLSWWHPAANSNHPNCPLIQGCREPGPEQSTDHKTMNSSLPMTL